MAWTTRIVHVVEDTGEVLQESTHNPNDWIKTGQEIIYTRINPTHNERIIIKKYRRSNQQRINF